jgi:PAS domain S-box-containing protein/excisionase family DNA binding protein
MGCQQAARYLGVSVKTIRRWAQSGRLDGTKVGTRGDWRFTSEQLDRVVSGDDMQMKHKKAKHALRQSEEMFAKAFHASPMAMTITKMSDGNWIDVNRNFLKLTGFTRQEVIGHNSVDLGLVIDNAPEDRRNAALDELRKTGTYSDSTRTIRTKKGELRRIRGSSVVVSIDGEDHAISFNEDVTEQARAEEVTHYLGALTESMADAVTSFDKDRHIVTWNMGAQKLYGWTAKEAIGRDISELLEPLYTTDQQSLDKTRREAYVALINKGHWEGEVVQQTKRGRLKDVHSSLAAIRNPSGELIGSVAVNRDISARKKAERALAEREQRYRVLFNSIDEGFCIIEMLYNDDGRAIDYKFLEVNAVFEKVSRMKNPIGMTLREWVPTITDSWIERYAQVAETGKSNRSTDWSNSNGRWYEVYATRVGSPESKTVALLFTDITEQRRLEDERQSAMRQIINTLESISDGFFQLDRKWNIVMVNERFLMLIRKDRDKVLGRNFWRIFPSAKSPNANFYKNFLRVMATRKSATFIDFYAPLEIWAEVNAYPTEDGISVFLRDITQQRLAEKEQELYRQLTLEHTELIKVNKAKDEFIGIASHQLRTPATAVKQYIGILLSGIGGSLSDAQREYLETAHDSNERQLRLINDLLKTAQIDAETFTLNRSHHSIASLVDESIRGLKPTLEQRQQTVIVKDLSNNAVADVDGIEMDLVFSNIIENASKYSHNGKKIIVTIRKKAHAVEITISDEGVGIGEADLMKIFEKFTRVDNELSDTITGTGLGLYWVRHIVNMHGGRITVSSVLNKGSIFKVVIPL